MPKNSLKNSALPSNSPLRRPLVRKFVLFLSVAALLGSCAISASRAKAGTAEVRAETRPDIRDRSALTVSFSSEDIELDFRKSYLATEAQIYTALYEGLFSYHPWSMEPVPAAASKWQLSEDKKEWTFTIRDNARYMNGDPLRSGDFRDAWISTLDPERDAPYSSLFDIIEGAQDYRTGKTKSTEKIGIKTPDDSTIIVRLTSPASFFPAMLCHHSFSPIHPSLLKEGVQNGKQLISNGPFYLVARNNKTLELAKNEYYWDVKEVALDKITIRLTESGEDAAELWNSGEARWVSGHINFDKLKDRSGLALNPIFATHYYYIRSARTPWNDYRIRRAMVLVLPWTNLRKGYFLPAKTLIYPISGYPEISGLDTTDTPKAKELLVQAGFPGGNGLPELILRISPGRESERIGALMAATWGAELGLKVKIELIPFPAYFDSLKQDNYDVGFSTWIGDFADPYTFLQMWRRDSNLNDARYNDIDFEKLLDRSMGEDGEKRYKTLSEAEKLLLERGTVIPISHSYAINVVDTSELDGWFRNVLDIHPFKYFGYRDRKPMPGVVLLR